MTRQEDWAGFDANTTLRLVSRDLDHHDRDFELLNKRLDRMTSVLIGILISVTTSAILLAVNLGVA